MPYGDIMPFIYLLTFGGVSLLIMLYFVCKSKNMKKSKKIAIVVTAIALFTVALYLSPPPVPEIGMWLAIQKLENHEPYFVLDEEMVVYPLFRSILDEMEAEGRKHGWAYISFEEYEKMDFPAHFFKYESNFYKYTIVVI